MDAEKIGKFIKQLRQEKGLSQNDLAEQIHITRQAISNWETGKSIPDSELLRTLSKLFHIKVDDLLSGEIITERNHLEKTALFLYDETNKKRSTIKRLMRTLIISFLSVIVLFLTYYFITNYNSIKVYTVSGEKDNYEVSNGIILTTQKMNYLKVGRISSKENNLEIIESLELYYINKDNKKIKIYQINQLEDIVTKYSFKNNKEEHQLLNNLYLRIVDNEKKETIMKLHTSEDYKNSFFINTKNLDKTETTHKEEIENEISIEFNEEEKEEENSILKEEVEIPVIEIDNSSNTAIPVVENQNEEINDEEINYEEIQQKVIEQGTEEYGRYTILKEMDGEIISISSTKEVINIDVMINNTLYCWQIDINNELISFQQFENYIQTNDKKYYINEEKFKDNVEMMNQYIKKVISE